MCSCWRCLHLWCTSSCRLRVVAAPVAVAAGPPSPSTRAARSLLHRQPPYHTCMFACYVGQHRPAAPPRGACRAAGPRDRVRLYDALPPGRRAVRRHAAARQISTVPSYLTPTLNPCVYVRRPEVATAAGCSGASARRPGPPGSCPPLQLRCAAAARSAAFKPAGPAPGSRAGLPAFAYR